MTKTKKMKKLEKILFEQGYEMLSVINVDAPKVYIATYNDYCMMKNSYKPAVHKAAQKKGLEKVYEKYCK